MKCEVCGAELSSEALELNSCMKCGAIIDLDAPVKDITQYKRKAEFVDSIQSLMNTNLTQTRAVEEQKQETLKKVNDAFEYRAEIIASNPDGTISGEKLNSQLKVYAEKGWRLANSFCNVIGKSQVAGYGGVTGGLAANGSVPITQIILIFERRTGAARRMPPAGAPGAPAGAPGTPGGAPGTPAGGVGARPAQPAPPKSGADENGVLFAGKKPTPRPMTQEELNQVNKQKPLPGQVARPQGQNDQGGEPPKGQGGEGGGPRIIPIR